MKNTIGFLKDMNGEFFAQDKDGNIREVIAGDMILEGEVVVTFSGAIVWDSMDMVEDNFEEYLDDEVCIIIGHLKELKGDFFAQDKNGVNRQIFPGEGVKDGEIVVNSKGERVIDPFVVANIDNTIFSSGSIVNIEAPLQDNIERSDNRLEANDISSRVLENSFYNGYNSTESVNIYTQVKTTLLPSLSMPISLSTAQPIDALESIPTVSREFPIDESSSIPVIYRDSYLPFQDIPIQEESIYIPNIKVPLKGSVEELIYIPTIGVPSRENLFDDTIIEIPDGGGSTGGDSTGGGSTGGGSTGGGSTGGGSTGGGSTGGGSTGGGSTGGGSTGGGSTGGGSTGGGTPAIDPNQQYNYLSEEGLDGGVIDNIGNNDTTDAISSSGQFIVTDPNPDDILIVTLLSPNNSYSSNGENIVWNLSDDGHILIGATMTGSNPSDVIKVEIDDSGAYTTNLFRPIDHDAPISGKVENEINISIGVRVTDDTGLFDDAVLNLVIEDDAPLTANGINVINIDIEMISTNLSFIVDISSSMSDQDLADTQLAINAVVDKYSEMGDVNVNIVQFYSDGNHQSGWMDVDGSKDVVLDSNKSGTDIENGLRTMVENSYSGNQPDATQDIMYFFGDGNTYDGNTQHFQTDFDAYTGIDDREHEGDAIDNVDYDNLWTNFITSGQIDKLYTYSVNSSMLVDIAHLADNDEDEISKEAVNLSDISDLKNALLSTVELYQYGTLASDADGNQLISFGADGGHLDEVSIGGVVARYDKNNPQQTIVGQHGSFVIDFNTGTYRYVVSDTVGGAHVETITAKIVDNDGDESDILNIQINIAYSEHFSKAPIIVESDNSVVQDISQTIGSAIDANGTIEHWVMGATHGSVSLGANGEIVYTPYSGFKGSDIVSVLVTDNDGHTSTRNIAVNVIDEADNADAPLLQMNINNGTEILNSSIDITDDFTDGVYGWSGEGVSEVNGSLHIEQKYHTASKIFYFGDDSANKEITITYKSDIDDNQWDDGDDAMRVHINNNNNSYNQTKIDELDGDITHTIVTNLDKDGKLEIGILNDSNSTNPEWLEIDDFHIESGSSYEYEVTLNASKSDTDETLSNLNIKDIPDGARIKDNSGNIIEADEDGNYIIAQDPIDGGSVTVYIITDAQMTTAQNNNIKASVTSIEDSGDKATVEVTDGSTPQIIDGIIEGLAYTTSSGFNDVTDANGGFSHLEGDSVEFMVGDTVIGKIDMNNIDDDKVFLQDLADVDRDDMDDKYVENMAVFLQSIDSDDGDNILISDETKDLFDKDIDLMEISSEELANILEESGEDVVSVEDAMEHVEEMMREYDGVEDNILFIDDNILDDIIDNDNEEEVVEDMVTPLQDSKEESSPLDIVAEYASSDDVTVIVSVDDILLGIY